MAKKKPLRSRIPSIITTAQAPLSDQPWWIRSLVWVGAPTAVAGYLLWFVVNGVITKLDHMNDNLLKSTVELTAVKVEIQGVTKRLEQDASQHWVELGIMQRTCINAGRTDADKLACTMTRGQ